MSSDTTPVALCPDCKGHSRVPSFVRFAPEATEADQQRFYDAPPAFVCSLCQGRGIVTEEVAARFARGQELRRLRLEAGYGLRHYAEAIGILPGALSQMEQGLIEPMEFRLPEDSRDDRT
jgi:hypothetical protein